MPHADKKANWLDPMLWVLMSSAFLIAVAYGVQFNNFLNQSGPTILVSIIVLYSFGHAYRRYGLKNFLVFLAIVLVTGNFYENMSIATTFPFGPYHYTDNLGPKFIFTPLVINIAYFQMIYLAWNLSGAVLGYFRNVPKGPYILIQPVIAMFIAVMWDLSMDPYMSTVSHNWEWHHGGAYFGVPIQNFYGWYLTVFTMFLLFSVYMSRQKTERVPSFVVTKINWVQLTSVYLIWVLNYVLLGVFNTNAPAPAFNNQIWQSRDIMLSGGLISVGTMLFVGVLVLVKVLWLDVLPRQDKQASH